MKEFTNNYGIKIKICCASCANCKLVSCEQHRCQIKNEETLPQFTCIAWQPKPKLMNAGIGNGVVRRKEEIIKQWQKKIEQGALHL